MTSNVFSYFSDTIFSFILKTARSFKTGSGCRNKREGGGQPGGTVLYNNEFSPETQKTQLCEWGVAPPDAKLHQRASLDTNKSCQTLQKAKRAQYIPAG